MGLYKKIKMALRGGKHDYVPILIQQADFISKSSSLLSDMFSSSDRGLWVSAEREIKSCEVQGDALLSEFHEMLSGSERKKDTKLKEAKEMICHMLAGGKQVLSEEIDREAVKRGISTRTIRDAKKELGDALKSKVTTGWRKLFWME